jgi:phospholipid/cholesterol/gamma-HCH transport system substrate-binding protein
MSAPPAPADDALAPAKLRSRRRQIVALILVSVLLAALMAGAIAWHQGGFTRAAQVYFIADDVTGLAPGTVVRMSGFRVGKIAAMELQPDLKVKVVLAIDAESFGYLHADARAVLVREQLKPAAIDLRAGSATAPLAAADPQVTFAHRGTLTEIADDLRNRLAPILDDVRQLTSLARERRGEIDDLIANMHSVSRELAGTAREAHALSADLRARVGALGAQSQATLGEANRSIVRLGALVGQAEGSLGTINGRLPGVFEKTDAILGHLEAVLRDSRTISGAAAAAVPGVLRDVTPIVEDSREIVQGVRQSWPVRGVLPPPAPALLPIDSHDSSAVRGGGGR